MVGENFHIYGVQMINQKIQTKKNKFRHLIQTKFRIRQNFPQSSYYHLLGRAKLLLPLGCIFSKKKFPPEREIRQLG